jgi:hypothetical protein
MQCVIYSIKQNKKLKKIKSFKKLKKLKEKKRGGVFRPRSKSKMRIVETTHKSPMPPPVWLEGGSATPKGQTQNVFFFLAL